MNEQKQGMFSSFPEIPLIFLVPFGVAGYVHDPTKDVSLWNMLCVALRHDHQTFTNLLYSGLFERIVSVSRAEINMTSKFATQVNFTFKV